MKEYRLRLELLSAAAPGSGEGSAGVIDQDVPHDDLGLPVLWGRRMKGLLRESVLVIEEWGDLAQGCTRELFGTGNAQGLVRVGNAELEEAAQLKPWLQWLRSLEMRESKVVRVFAAEQVLSCYTELRQQTAMDRRTGAPLRQSLRRLRLLRRGLTFSADVVLASDRDDHERALALGCAGIKRMGTNRNRGMGTVQCALLSDGKDLTSEALQAIAQGEDDS